MKEMLIYDGYGGICLPAAGKYARRRNRGTACKSPPVHDPSIEEKIEILHMMECVNRDGEYRIAGRPRPMRRENLAKKLPAPG